MSAHCSALWKRFHSRLLGLPVGEAVWACWEAGPGAACSPPLGARSPSDGSPHRCLLAAPPPLWSLHHPPLHREAQSLCLQKEKLKKSLFYCKIKSTWRNCMKIRILITCSNLDKLNITKYFEGFITPLFNDFLKICSKLHYTEWRRVLTNY